MVLQGSLTLSVREPETVYQTFIGELVMDLKKVLEDWLENPAKGVKADLRGADLRGVNLENTILKGIKI